MLVDNLFCSDFRRHVERYLLLKPRSFNHSRLLVFNIAERAWNYVSHAVYKADVKPRLILKRKLNRVLRNKLRFGCHYCPTR